MTVTAESLVWPLERPEGDARAPDYPDGVPPETLTALVAAVADQLRGLHEKGQAHGGVRPSALRREGTSWMLAAPSECSSPRREAREEWLEWAIYAAPEMIEGARPSPAADIYALGVTAAELAVAAVPFELDRVESADRFQARSTSAALQPVWTWIRRMIESAPGKRISAGDLVNVLRPRRLSNEPGASPPRGPDASTVRRAPDASTHRASPIQEPTRVTNLEVQDCGSYVQLRWEWPPDRERLVARILWRRFGEPSDPEDRASDRGEIQPAEYVERGGFRISPPPAPGDYRVAIFSGRYDGGQARFSVDPVRASMTIRRPIVLRVELVSHLSTMLTKKMTLTVSSSEDIPSLPPLVVVVRSGETVPLAIGQGETIAEIGGGVRFHAGIRLEQPIEIRQRRPFAVGVFVAADVEMGRYEVEAQSSMVFR